jgi:hypothetical protein
MERTRPAVNYLHRLHPEHSLPEGRFRAVAEELGVPVPTVKTWHRRIHLNPGKAPKRPGNYYQTCAVSDLQTLAGAGKKFGCIYADPPWRYGNQGTRAATDNHYPTMSPAVIEVLELWAERSQPAWESRRRRRRRHLR